VLDDLSTGNAAALSGCDVELVEATVLDAGTVTKLVAEEKTIDGNLRAPVSLPDAQDAEAQILSEAIRTCLRISS